MFEVIGWFGTLLYLINHAYISLFKQWKKRIYYAGNLIAALCLVVSSWQVASYQAVSINSFWAVVSLALLLALPVEKIPFSRSAFYSVFGLFIGLIVYQSFLQQQVNYMLLGWLSTYTFCFGYLLFSSNKLKHTNYLLLNFCAAVVLIPQLWLDNNLPVLGLEIAWAIISIYGVVKNLSHSHLID